MKSIDYFRNMSGKYFEKIKRFVTIKELLEYDIDNFKDDIAISWLNGEKTYSDLYHDVAKLRKLFKDTGIKKGDNVAVIFRNEYDFVRSFFALTTLGACAVIVPTAMQIDALLTSIKKFDIVALVYGLDAKDNVETIKKTLSNLYYISCESFTDAIGEIEADPNILPADSACIIFTGGTTGKAKGAILSHRALLRGGYNGCFIEGNPFGLKYMVLIPFLHVFGLVRNLMTSMNSGSNLYLVKYVKDFTNEIKKAKPEIMVLVPYLADVIYSIIAQHGKEAVGGKLRLIIAGGANVSTECINKLLSVGITVCPGYGLTETANLTSGSIEYKRRPSSVGMVFPEQEVKIVDGEIYVRGDNLFSGYYNDIDETKNVMSEDGYLKTGDLGRFDSEGFLYITGRKKNLIVLDNGENVSPEIIENELDNMPLIKSSLVYKDKDGNGHDIIAVKVFPNFSLFINTKHEGINSAINDLINKINDKMPKYMRVKKVVISKEDLKRTANFKISRK